MSISEFATAIAIIYFAWRIIKSARKLYKSAIPLLKQLLAEDGYIMTRIHNRRIGQ